MKLFKILSIFILLMPIVLNGAASYAQEENIQKIERSKEDLTMGTTEQSIEESSFTTEETTLSTMDSSTSENTDEVKNSPEKITVTFLAPEGHVFLNQETTIDLLVMKNESLESDLLPELELDQRTDEFQGWELEGQLITQTDLLKLKISKSISLTAKIRDKEKQPLVRSIDGSISSIINQADKSKLIVVPDPSGTGEIYKEYTSTDDGLRAALVDLYHNGNKQDFTIYIGTNFTVNALTLAKIIPSVVDKTNVTFYSLQGKVNTITLTGDASDPISNSNTALPSSKTLTLSANSHFGTDIVVRNLRYNGSTIFMNGHKLFLNGGSYGNGFSIYGGTDEGDIVGSPSITVNSTGSGTWNFFGGNQSGGKLTGNIQTTINQTSGNISSLNGGANKGVVAGNVQIEVNDAGGTISSIYGGGYGANANNWASVNGSVTTKIRAPQGTALQIGDVYGGVLNGNIGGGVLTDISGYGRWTNTTRTFVGGSGTGNIGLNRSVSAITSNLNTSNFTSGRASFIGANVSKGTIIGNISSTLTAGGYTSGGFNEINGGGGNNISKLSKNGIGGANVVTYDAYSPTERAKLAENSADFKVYGNISTYLVSGSFSNGDNYSTAAGRGGYIEGDTSILVGTANTNGTTGGAGLAYKGNLPTSLAYSTTDKRRGNSSNWDIVGGGGAPSSNSIWDVYIKGNTSTTINNAVARWTYGGGFSGIIEGNTFNTMYGGIVDTFEGTGYNGGRVFGNGQSTIYNGQVDWFLTGGSWNDGKVVGNVGVTVYDGTINASMGASYGVDSSHVITGNSNNVIYGGDFSGTPNSGNNGFSGGITNNGTLMGDANLTIDLRKYEGTFKLPGGTSISGGVPYNVNTNLGTNSTNKITLNIFTKPGTDVLNGANIYGDGGRLASSTKSGKIIMNIDAPGSKIGNLYATNYSNISSNKILRDVQSNVQRADSINGISGGATADDFTSVIVNGSENQAKFIFGAKITSTEGQAHPIDVTGTGIVNFTNLEVNNQTSVIANGGNILNGKNATAANHSSTYSSFGDIVLKENSALGIRTGSNYISAGKLIIQDEARIISVPGAGKINISDFIASNDQTDRLTWIKADVSGGSGPVASTGTWFGGSNAYQVLTINPNSTNASKVTPFNFKGVDEATGKTFIGDNDLTKGANGYGIAIPGSVIDYEVGKPVQFGQGDIKHNVDQVTQGNTPTPIKVWGTEVAGLPVQKGRLIVPLGTKILPKLTFTPETKDTGSWLYQGTITSSSINSNPEKIKEQNESNPVDWTSPNGEYSYTVKVQYSNKAELSARNVVLTESEAGKIKDSGDVAKYTEVQGRPFLKDDVTQTKIKEINQPLEAEQTHRTTKVIYTAGTTIENRISQSVNLVVVKDDFELSEHRLFAVSAQSAKLKIEEANGLVNQKALEDSYTKPIVVLADGTTTVATSESATFLAIKNTVESELAKSVDVSYSFTKDEDQASKSVVVKIVGILEITATPSSFNFGEQVITNRTKTYWPKIIGDLTVKDTRGTDRKTWQLLLKEERPLTSGSESLDQLLSFVDQSKEQPISEDNIIVETYKLNSNGEYVVTNGWGREKNKGIKLTVPVKKQKVGEYTGTLKWTLVDAPTNE